VCSRYDAQGFLLAHNNHLEEWWSKEMAILTMKDVDALII
jgi:hypothetical protein